jgi:hypothetical protein
VEPIGLRDAVEALRAELSASVASAVDESLKFEVGEMQLEFEVAIERVAEGSGGIRFWVIELGGKASHASTRTHKVTVPLKPVNADGRPVLTGSETVPAPGPPPDEE